jgi:hypothetical protein
MNSASLLLGVLLLGQSTPATQPRKSPLGPRYRSAPAATAPSDTSASKGAASPAQPAQGLPVLPGGMGPRGAAQGLPRGGISKAGQGSGTELPDAANPVELAPANNSGEIPDSINLPAHGPGNNVGSNPFPAPEGANPLRASDSEIPAANVNDAEAPPLQTPAYDPNEVVDPTQQQPQQQQLEQQLPQQLQPAEPLRFTQPQGSTELEVEPRQFEPSGTIAPQDPPASSFVPAVIDEHVTPASLPANTELVAVQPPEKEPAPDRLLREALTPPELNSLAGKPVTLDELLASHESVSEKHATILRVYWQLCSALARYHWAVEELHTLEQVITGRQVPFTVTAELAALRARVLQTKAAAVEAQHALAVFRVRPPGTELPLPVDRPVVAAYRTYYESLFANRTGDPAVRNAQRLNETMPLHLEAARALAEAVAEAEDLARPASNANAQNQLDLNSLIQAQRHLHSQREAFISEVQTYNQAIADYALLAVSPGSPAATLLPMLIKVKPRTPSDTTNASTITPTPSLPAGQPVLVSETFASGTTASPSGVIPATAEVPIASSPAIGPVAAKPLRSVLVRSNKR